MKKLLFILLLSLPDGSTGFVGSQPQPEYKNVATKNWAETLQTGDLVMRRGRGLISDMFAATSKREKRFSHAGMLLREKGECFVVHCIGGKYGNGIVKEPLQRFCGSNYSLAVSCYRYSELQNRQGEVAYYLEKKLAEAVSFDEKFDLTTDDAMYCTELVYKVIRDVAHINLPYSLLGKDKYIGLDDLYLNAYAHRIKDISFHE